MKNYAPILVTEDDAADVLFLRRALKKAAVPNPIVLVPNGREAMRYLAGENGFADRDKHPLPALILVDLKTPEGDGFGLLAWLREQTALQQVPAVVLTASQLDEDRDRSTQLGARDYFVKPLVTDQLIPMVQQIQARWLEPQPPSPAEEAAPAQASAPKTANDDTAYFIANNLPAQSAAVVESAPDQPALRELAAAKLGCRPEEFDKVIFRRCLFPHARVFSWVLPRTAFAADWLLIRDAAGAHSFREVIQTVNDHRYIHPEDETTMHALKIRISGRKLIRLAKEIFGPNGAEESEE